jgi:uncharacterized RDD family membrane protein YckC
MTEQQISEYDNTNSLAEPAAELWRNELQDRLARYQRRRGRRIEGAFSMRFPFPVDETAEPVTAVEPVAVVTVSPDAASEEAAQPEVHADALPVDHLAEAVAKPVDTTTAVPQADERQEEADLLLETVPVPEPEPEPFVDTIIRPRPKRKVIAFPRHRSVAPETVYRLADPVTAEVPRILDVPEELEAIPTTPFLDGLQLDPARPADNMRDREHVELPFLAVTISRRLCAGLIDVAVTAVGVAVFAAVTLKSLANPPLSKPLILGIAAAAVLLWSAYQYLFVVHAGKTVGMMAARIRLRTFKGKGPTLRQRRHRVLGFYLSALSLGMGLMWAFVDVDTLCWHDRLSRTYLANRQ